MIFFPSKEETLREKEDEVSFHYYNHDGCLVYDTNGREGAQVAEGSFFFFASFSCHLAHLVLHLRLRICFFSKPHPI